MMRRPRLALLALIVASCSSTRPGTSPGTSSASNTATSAPAASSVASSTDAPSTVTTVSPAPTSAAPATREPSWTTFGGAPDRRGLASNGPNPTRVRQAWASEQLDGDLYGEPLVVAGRVIVATEGDSVYSFDAATGAQAWKVNLGEPIPRSALECGNIDPTGITSTPVIDLDTSTLYVVAFVQPGRHDLIAIDLGDGSVRWRRPADPPGLDPFHEQQRSALLLANGRVYIAYGGLFGDCGPYKGAVMAFKLDGSGDPQSWIVPTRREGGLWAPSGPAAGANGDLYVAVGNAASTDPASFDDGNAVVRLSPDLAPLDVWAPADWYSLSASDADLGSIGPLPLDGGRIFVAGKNGVGYVLDAGHLGGVGGEVGNAGICDGGAFGGSATDGAVVVVGCGGGPVGVKVAADGGIAAVWHGPGGRSGAPVIAGGSAWIVSNTGHLLALDTATGSTQADIDLRRRIPGFPTPTVTANAVYAPAGPQLLAFAPG